MADSPHGKKGDEVAPKCANCDIEITGQPVVVDGQTYCCQGCANGGPCTCSYLPVSSTVEPKQSAKTASQVLMGDVVSSCLQLLDSWQKQGSKSRQADFDQALQQAAVILKEAAGKLESQEARQVQSKPAAVAPREDTATITVSGLASDEALKEYSQRLAQSSGIKRCSLVSLAQGTATWQVWYTSLEDTYKSILTMPGFPASKINIAGENIEVLLGKAEKTPRTPAGERGTSPLELPVYELGVDLFLNARHYVSNGTKGPTHPHSWRIQARVTGKPSGDHSTLIGFADIKQLVQKQLTPYNGALLNQVDPFDKIMPTTENIAAVFYDQLNSAFSGPELSLTSVCVWESPTNYVLYRGKRS